MQTITSKCSEDMRRQTSNNFTIFNFTNLWAKSADDKLMIFFLIFPRKSALRFHVNHITQKISFEMSCKLSPKEKIYKKSQRLFSEKIKCHLLKILPSMLNIKSLPNEPETFTKTSYLVLTETIYLHRTKNILACLVLDISVLKCVCFRLSLSLSFLGFACSFCL